MTNGKGFRLAPGLALVGTITVVALSNGCSAANAVAAAAQGCDEFKGGASSVASLSIDANTKAFVQASADLVSTTSAMQNAVLAACTGIDHDLGVADTWTAKGSTNDQITEACNQASTKITGILQAQQQVQATCALAVTGGGCTVDVNAEASCDAQCTGGASCTPPDITVACEPGQLSGQCSGTCNASATCEGSATVAAKCQGSCEADCEGSCTPPTSGKVHCEGTCMGNCFGTCNGTATGAGGMANCAGTCSGQCDAQCTYTPGKPGHCEGSCTGTCTGNCKLDASSNINCGANVNCKGGCSVMYTAPKCEGSVTPPMCMADVNCKGSCQAHAEATASCTPPTAKLECSASATSDVQALVATVEKNLPALVQAVSTQGPIAVKAAGHVASTAVAVGQTLTSLSGKALACAGAAVQASASASVSINVSVMASASVSGSCGGPTTGS